MKSKYALYTALALLYCGSSHAGNYTYGNGYFGLGFGATDNNAHTNDLISPNVCNVAGSTCSADTSDQSWQVYGGYNFSPFWGVEGAYVDLGTTANISDGTIRGTQDTKGVSLSAVGRVPVGPTSVYGKAGIYHWDSDARAGSSGSFQHTDSSGTDPVLGLGVEYKMGQQWTARLGWDRYFNVGEKNNLLDSGGPNTLKTDVDVYTIGLQYDFK